MHEMALARDVVDLVVGYAERANAARVTTVYMTIGSGRDVVEDLFDGVFGYLARGTVAEHAELVVHRTPYMARCNRCGMVFHVDVFDRATWACPECGAQRDYRLVSGMEFQVNRIEVTGVRESPDASRAGSTASGGTCGEGAPAQASARALEALPA
jgi:hydrogenase nickel incorporation protein HypA/HybF